MAINAKSRGFLFDEVKITSPKFSAFDMSFENKLSSNMGFLIPTLCKEVLPGDYLELQSSSLIRFAPTLAPILHNIDVMTYTFFVPNRLIWNEFEKFISPGAGSVTMRNQPNFVPPISPYTTFADLDEYYNSGDFGTYKGLADYLGVPDARITSAGLSHLSVLPFRAYQLVWNEYFRDQNLETDIFTPDSNGQYITKDSGYIESGSSTDELDKLLTLHRKSWEKDYFTSALPTPQRGAQVLLPLGTEAPLLVTSDNSNLVLGSVSGEYQPYQTEQYVFMNSSSANAGSASVSLTASNPHAVRLTSSNNQTSEIYAEASNGSISGDVALSRLDLLNLSNRFKVDLSSASSATVETLRNAFKLQEFLEKSARSGARYIENILAHFGVTSSDARLDRPELLGTARRPVVVSPVEQQSESADQTSPTGTLYGKLTSSYKTDVVRYRAEEHGFILQLQCVLPRTSYQQGLHRMWTRETYLDYAWPEFAHLGEQEVYNREIYNGFTPYFSGDGSAHSVTDSWRNEVFGYQPRYAEYKYNLDEVHGDFKGSLRYWHLSRLFRSAPTLSPSFIHADPRYDIFAVTDSSVHHLYQEIWHEFKMLRALPEYGTPHF